MNSILYRFRLRLITPYPRHISKNHSPRQMHVRFDTLRSYEKLTLAWSELDVWLTHLIQLFSNPLIQAFRFAPRRDKNFSVQRGR